MNRENIKSTLFNLGKDGSFVINDRYECKFDLNNRHSSSTSIFTGWTSDANCNSSYSRKANVIVYDRESSTTYKGTFYVVENRDLKTESKNSMHLHIKSNGYEMCTTAVNIDEIQMKGNNQ